MLQSVTMKFIFEMERKGAETSEQMLDWDYGNKEMSEVKYEELICDTDFALFGRIFRFLRFDRETRKILLSSAHEVSLRPKGPPRVMSMCARELHVSGEQNSDEGTGSDFLRFSVRRS